jgi:putative DNA primase/helicase
MDDNITDRCGQDSLSTTPAALDGQTDPEANVRKEPSAGTEAGLPPPSDDRSGRLRQAAAHLATIEPVISGQDQTRRAASDLLHGFALSPAEAGPLLTAWSQACGANWPDSSLAWILRSVARQADDRPHGSLFNPGVHQPANGPVESGTDAANAGAGEAAGETQTGAHAEPGEEPGKPSEEPGRPGVDEAEADVQADPPADAAAGPTNDQSDPAGMAPPEGAPLVWVVADYESNRPDVLGRADIREGYLIGKGQDVNSAVVRFGDRDETVFPCNVFQDGQSLDGSLEIVPLSDDQFEIRPVLSAAPRVAEPAPGVNGQTAELPTVWVVADDEHGRFLRGPGVFLGEGPDGATVRVRFEDNQEKVVLKRDTFGKNGRSLDGTLRLIREEDGSVTIERVPPPAPDPQKTRPVVEVFRGNNKTNQAVFSHLPNIKSIYQRARMLVRIMRSDKNIKGFNIPPNTMIISRIDDSCLDHILSGELAFMRRGEKRLQPADLPERCIKAILNFGEWERVPHLTGIVEHPVIRPDGSIAAGDNDSRPGYDKVTGIAWEGEPCQVPERPTQDAARKATVQLLELVEEFEFESEVSRAVWLAALLTGLARHLVNGAVPLFYFDANTAGSGKSLLCDLISCILIGREMTRTSYSHDNVEMDKRILSILLMGLRTTLLDNIEGEFGNSALDAVLTGRYYSGRILGKSKMSVSLPVDTVFLATANNAIFAGDLFRRVIQCRLVSSYARPDIERTKFKIPKIVRHTIENRQQYLTCALTILRGYLQAGCPHNFPENVFPEWTQIVRGCVKWTMDVDPWQDRETTVEDDPRRMAQAALLEGLVELIRRLNALRIGRNPREEEQSRITSAEILRSLDGFDSYGRTGEREYQTLRDAIYELWNCRNGQLPSVKALGRMLGSMEKTRFGDLRILKWIDPHKTTWWAIEEFKRGFDLRLLSWGDGSGVPTSGQNLVIVGTGHNGLLHIKVFTPSGKLVIDTDETQLPPAQAGAISSLKQRLPGWLPPHVLTPAEKAQVISEATAIVSQTLNQIEELWEVII